MEIKVLVAAHKQYRMPEDCMYLPVFVGAGVNSSRLEESEKNSLISYQRDDRGDNISDKNPLYCELTALYWGWKNLDSDYLGLVHYRRHFVKRAGSFSWENLLTKEDAEAYFNRGYSAILPKKRHYVIETIYSHYIHSHHAEDLEVTEKIIKRSFPDYLNAYKTVMKSRSAHMFNMCIMEKRLLDQYCEWLFEILEQVESVLDISGYSDFDKRVFGRISELLMDVWITNNKIRFAEIPVRNPEGEKIFEKAAAVIRRKISSK